MVDHSQMKLGKGPVKHGKLRLAAYLRPAELAQPPSSVDWTKGRKEWGMLGNDLALLTSSLRR
ncbi:MAG: hypothetical protein ACRD37_06395 [Candidatus Acidiferrales bacterium]